MDRSCGVQKWTRVVVDDPVVTGMSGKRRLIVLFHLFDFEIQSISVSVSTARIYYFQLFSLYPCLRFHGLCFHLFSIPRVRRDVVCPFHWGDGYDWRRDHRGRSDRRNVLFWTFRGTQRTVRRYKHSAVAYQLLLLCPQSEDEEESGELRSGPK